MFSNYVEAVISGFLGKLYSKKVQRQLSKDFHINQTSKVFEELFLSKLARLENTNTGLSLYTKLIYFHARSYIKIYLLNNFTKLILMKKNKQVRKPIKFFKQDFGCWVTNIYFKSFVYLPKKTKVRVRHKHFLAFLKRDFFFRRQKTVSSKAVSAVQPIWKCISRRAEQRKQRKMGERKQHCLNRKTECNKSQKRVKQQR